MTSVREPLTAQAVHDWVRAELDAVDAAHDRLRSICTDLAGNAFRIEVAERLERQQRVNRGLPYRMFGEIAEPVDGSSLPAGVKVRDVLAGRLRLTAAEVKRRFAVAARLRPRRSLIGPALPPELPSLAAAVEAGEVGEDHVAEVCRALERLPASVTPADLQAAEPRTAGSRGAMAPAHRGSTMHTTRNGCSARMTRRTRSRGDFLTRLVRRADAGKGKQPHDHPPTGGVRR